MATTVMSGVFDRARWNGLYRCYRKWQRARQQMQDEQVSAEVRQTANATFYAESERWQDLLETAVGGVAMARRLRACLQFESPSPAKRGSPGRGCEKSRSDGIQHEL